MKQFGLSLFRLECQCIFGRNFYKNLPKFHRFQIHFVLIEKILIGNRRPQLRLFLKKLWKFT